MALLSTFCGASDFLLSCYKTKTPITTKKTEEFQELAQAPDDNTISIQNKTTRRNLIGVGVLALSTNCSIQITLADGGNNGWWLEGPLPIPPVYNNIANEETGTRSFLKKGLYMAEIGPTGSAYRLRKYAFDLLALEDLFGQEAWDHVRRYLRLKSTCMYYDFDKVITAAPQEEKQPLLNLANRLFDNVEKLEDALKKRNEEQSASYYKDTKPILEEVMMKMA